MPPAKLTPEEKQRIYLEERAREEAREKAKRDIRFERRNKGCIGWLAVLGLFVVFIMVFIMLIDTDKPKTTDSGKRVPRKEVPAAAHRHQLLEELNRIQENSVRFFDSVGKGVNEGQVVITVTDLWHLAPYQERLQAAQSLWQEWANIHSPQDVDRARIKLVDLSGNEVGGSRILAGSLIWVQER